MTVLYLLLLRQGPGTGVVLGTGAIGQRGELGSILQRSLDCRGKCCTLRLKMAKHCLWFKDIKIEDVGIVGGKVSRDAFRSAPVDVRSHAHLLWPLTECFSR